MSRRRFPTFYNRRLQETLAIEQESLLALLG